MTCASGAVTPAGAAPVQIERATHSEQGYFRMSVSLAVLGQRLREARQALGITQEAAAAAVGVPRTAIVHIEAGNRSISTVELSSLAELYRRPVVSFLAEDLPYEDPLVALHRLAPEAKADPSVAVQVARCVELCREGWRLSAALGRGPRSGPPAYFGPPPSGFGEAVRQGEFVAAEERRRLGIGFAPVREMAELIGQQGVWAAGLTLPDEMSGLFLSHPDFGMAVIVNFSHLKARRRFSYAHEYAHALMDRASGVVVTTRGNAADLMEKRANAFAAAFLMPKAGVEAFLAAAGKGYQSRQTFHVYDVAGERSVEAEGRTAPGSQHVGYQDVAELAHHFLVGYEVAAYRLVDLGFVNRHELRELLAKKELAHSYLKLVGKYDDIQAKPSAHDRELTRQLIPLAVEAVRRRRLNRDDLARIGALLNVDRSVLSELAELG